MRWLTLLCTGCLVSPGLYEESRDRLENTAPVYGDCDEDGLGDRFVSAVLPEAPPPCGVWVDNAFDCDDLDRDAGHRSGPLCADDLGEDVVLFDGSDRQFAVVRGEHLTRRQAEDQCGPLGWGGELAFLTGGNLDTVGALLDQSSLWVGGDPDGIGFSMPDGVVIPDAALCADIDQASGLLVLTGPICLGTTSQREDDDRLFAGGFVCERLLWQDPTEE